jgi:DNA-binding FadR family transcriptional regulator
MPGRRRLSKRALREALDVLMKAGWLAPRDDPMTEDEP